MQQEQQILREHNLANLAEEQQDNTAAAARQSEKERQSQELEKRIRARRQSK